MPFLLMVLGGFKSAASFIGQWLSKRSLTEIVCIALGVIVLVQFTALRAEKRHSAKLQARVVQLTGEINRIHAESEKAAKSAKAISQDIRGKSDEENRRISGDAKSLGVSGPGKAVCPAVPPAARNDESIAEPDASGPALPSGDRAAVPWGWIVVRAEEHDQLLNEVKAWRQWHEEVLKVWPKSS